jgi:predicted AlkP superfamily phosphohydrolase/phosphomutase
MEGLSSTRRLSPKPRNLLPTAAPRRNCLLLALTAALVPPSCGRQPRIDNRVIILGFDGMDYELTRRLMDEGRMPHFSRMAGGGSFSPLETSIPPQSPVAWSDFITGMDSGGHGIFDFIHRRPETLLPYFSTSNAEAGGRTLRIGRWQFPLSSGKIELLRRGEPFWEVLERHGVPTTIVRMPANFPPSGSATRELSGMGTTDIIGSYGTFSFYTSEPFAFAGKDMGGGKVYEVDYRDHTVKAKLYGPDNPFLVEPEKATADFAVYVDAVEPAAKIAVGAEERILSVGEWSDWVPVEFPLIPTQSLPAMARFYLQEVRPELKLYVSPLNFDPLEAAAPVSTPPSFAAELAAASGRFYTQGMPEDTAALTEGVFSRDEFLAQAGMAGAEVIEQYRHVLAGFQGGLLFYYFGNLDQTSHMMWRPRDPGHPAYDAEKDAPYAQVIETLYQKMDDVVGRTLERLDDSGTLIVMSDHGFASWRRAFHLNAWLREHGYIAVKDPNLSKDPGVFANVDWSGTRAYGLGLNGLYINLKGRERDGVVEPSERAALLEEIGAGLLATVDPETGAPAVTRVYRTDQVFEDRGALGVGPDLIVGYAKGTRCLNASALGSVMGEVLTDNTDEWSGDHAMDHRAVPGVLLTSRPLKKEAGRIRDLSGAVLAEFGVEWDRD